MHDTANTSQFVIRPPLALGLAVIAGLAINWLVPLPFLPVDLPAGWLGAIVFVFALALVAWAVVTITRGGFECPHPTCRPPPSSRADRTASRATPSTSACSWV